MRFSLIGPDRVRGSRRPGTRSGRRLVLVVRINVHASVGGRNGSRSDRRERVRRRARPGYRAVAIDELRAIGRYQDDVPTGRINLLETAR